MGENLGETANTELGNAMETESVVESTDESVAETGEDILPILVEIDGHLVELKDYIKDRETENFSDGKVSNDELVVSMQEIKETVKVSNAVGFCIGFGVFIFLGFYLSYIVWRRM